MFDPSKCGMGFEVKELAERKKEKYWLGCNDHATKISIEMWL
jgi:hypothetical protein